jgi:hypothetical protein
VPRTDAAIKTLLVRRSRTFDERAVAAAPPSA